MLTLLLTNYLPYCCLWTSVLISDPNIERPSNSYVENYFGFLANNLFQHDAYIRPSRFLRTNREYILCIYKEFLLDLPKKSLTKSCHVKNSDFQSEKLSQEMWKKKVNNQKTKYSGRFLKQITRGIHQETNDLCLEKSTKCLYCREGRLDHTALWVQCDRSFDWVHQKCDCQNESYSGQFICKFCDNVDDLRKVGMNNGTEYNSLLLKPYNKLFDREQIERLTRQQRNSPDWYEERKKRLTASNFRKNCKAKGE